LYHIRIFEIFFCHFDLKQFSTFCPNAIFDNIAVHRLIPLTFLDQKLLPIFVVQRQLFTNLISQKIKIKCSILNKMTNKAKSSIESGKKLPLRKTLHFVEAGRHIVLPNGSDLQAFWRERLLEPRRHLPFPLNNKISQRLRSH
jgi:hypothetical protein